MAEGRTRIRETEYGTHGYGMESDSTFSELHGASVKFHFYRARLEAEENVRRRCTSRKSARRGEREVEEEKGGGGPLCGTFGFERGTFLVDRVLEKSKSEAKEKKKRKKEDDVVRRKLLRKSTNEESRRIGESSRHIDRD